MPRINTIEKSRKTQQCGHCHETIPVGAGYRWIKPRYGGKRIRCMKQACRFRPTDLSSAKTARIQEAIEDAQNRIDFAENHNELQEILQEVADVAREVAEEYQEASDGWAGGNGHEEFQEKADICESFADDLEGWQASGEIDEDHIRREAEEEEIGTGDDAWEQALQEMRDEANGALEGFEL